MRLPVNAVIHTTLVGLEPATFRSLVDCWSDALPVVPPSHHQYMYQSLFTIFYNAVAYKITIICVSQHPTWMRLYSLIVLMYRYHSLTCRYRSTAERSAYHATWDGQPRTRLCTCSGQERSSVRDHDGHVWGALSSGWRPTGALRGEGWPSLKPNSTPSRRRQSLPTQTW